MSQLHSPLKSLQEGHWFKLICGASYQHLPSVRNLALIYTLAGADCIDVAADPAAILAAKEGINLALKLAKIPSHGESLHKKTPWLMVSLNDGEDPHFRKAEFNPQFCPVDCWRPCEKICPANAIPFPPNPENNGVIEQRCYGCGRCLPVCPPQIITTHSYLATPHLITPFIINEEIDALEIHTQIGREKEFKKLWNHLIDFTERLKLIAISCPNGKDVLDYLWWLYEMISPRSIPLIWQMDGRPMSGDIGEGTTHATIKFGQKVLASQLPGYIQLAGGTNDHTVNKLKRVGLLRNSDRKTRFLNGIAYGSYARVLLTPILEELERLQLEQIQQFPPEILSPSWSSVTQLENMPELLEQGLHLAHTLVSQIKGEQGVNLSVTTQTILTGISST